jgi:hypothetical protein
MYSIFGPAKPRTAVRFRPPPPEKLQNSLVAEPRDVKVSRETLDFSSSLKNIAYPKLVAQMPESWSKMRLMVAIGPVGRVEFERVEELEFLGMTLAYLNDAEARVDLSPRAPLLKAVRDKLARAEGGGMSYTQAQTAAATAAMESTGALKRASLGPHL